VIAIQSLELREHAPPGSSHSQSRRKIFVA
jgi:hypothetical protein